MCRNKTKEEKLDFMDYENNTLYYKYCNAPHWMCVLFGDWQCRQVAPTFPAKQNLAHSESYGTNSLSFHYREYNINDTLIVLHADILLHH